jgi:hypothetical protein
LPTTFVLGEQGMREGSGQLLDVLCDAIASQLPADHLQDIRCGKLWIKDMNRFEVLQIAMSKSGVEQEGFPQPRRSQKRNQCLPGLQAINKSLESGLIAPTQKERAWSGCVRERIVLQVIKIEIHDCMTLSLKNNPHAEDIRQAYLTYNVSWRRDCDQGV